VLFALLDNEIDRVEIALFFGEGINFRTDEHSRVVDNNIALRCQRRQCKAKTIYVQQ
jgi:hypothetical protein